jgi:adenosine deaminase
LILGAVETIDHHPITRFIEAGIPISINTDDPMHFQTNIGREYEIAHTLGLDEDTLSEITRSAIRHSFTSSSRRDQLLKSIG